MTSVGKIATSPRVPFPICFTRQGFTPVKHVYRFTMTTKNFLTRIKLRKMLESAVMMLSLVGLIVNVSI